MKKLVLTLIVAMNAAPLFAEVDEFAEDSSMLTTYDAPSKKKDSSELFSNDGIQNTNFHQNKEKRQDLYSSERNWVEDRTPTKGSPEYSNLPAVPDLTRSKTVRQ